jgi:putative phosphoribosyl transferase
MLFKDRADAGKRLAERLLEYANRADVIVLGVPRGGVPVAAEIAARLNAPLDVFVLRKLGVPWQEELAFGAIASGGIRVLDEEIVESTGITPRTIEEVTARESRELERRQLVFRGSLPSLNLAGRTVILVDDGIATGSSLRAAVKALRQMNPARLVIAVPVAPESTCRRMKAEVDDLVCLYSPESFFAIGQFYSDFSQTSDAEVAELLRGASQGVAEGQAEPFRLQEGGRHGARR